MNRSLLIIISGPSGVGKTSIAQLLLEELMPLFHIEKIITYTTREQRNNEQDGIDYHFITHETFIEKKKQNFFFETTEYNGNFYGTPNIFHQKISSDISCLVVTDYTVAQQMKESFKNTLLFWITPPSLTILEERLKKRKTESDDLVKKRVEIAAKELEREEKLNHFNYHILNTYLPETVEKIKKIILNARTP